MNAIKTQDLGVKFILHQRKASTLLETMLNLVRQKTSNSVSTITNNETLWALKDVTFCVKEGEALGVIGKNGAGKSTLMQVLTGIYKPDKGIVETKGRLGLLQLGTGFHPELPGRDNIYLNGAILGLSKKDIDAIYESIVRFSELERFIDMPLKNYSSGMRARLGFSIAINIQPDILLIDEVLSVGDEGFRKKSKKKLDDLRERGKTIVFVSHAMGQVKNICDKAICLDQGRIVYEGNSAEVVDFYKEFVQKNSVKKEK